MPREWPIAAPLAEGDASLTTAAAPATGERSLAAVIQDFFLPPASRLTEQERALMTAMLHGLVERVADEVRARLSAEIAARSEAGPSELVDDLRRARLLEDAGLMALLLRLADGQRFADAAGLDRSTLQRWVADRQPAVAAAAMALVAARGRRRDRFGQPLVELSDLPMPAAETLVHAIGAALSQRAGAGSASAMVAAGDAVLADLDDGERVEALESALAAALGPDGRKGSGLLLDLAGDGDASLMAAILGAEAGIGAGEAWTLLTGGPERLALLLRMAEIERAEAARLLADAGPGFGLGDPARAIQAFDRLSAAEVAEARDRLQLPAGFRDAADRLRAHG